MIQPLASQWLVPLVDMVLKRVIEDRELFEVPDFVQAVRLRSMRLGSRAPRLARVALADGPPSGGLELHAADVVLDLEVEMDSDMVVETEVVLSNKVNQLLDALMRDRKERLNRVVLTASDVRCALVLRCRLRPGAKAAFVSLLSMEKPRFKLSGAHVDFNGVTTPIPVTALPGVERFAGSLAVRAVQARPILTLIPALILGSDADAGADADAVQEVMQYPQRFVPVDLQPFEHMVRGPPPVDSTRRTPPADPPPPPRIPGRQPPLLCLPAAACAPL